MNDNGIQNKKFDELGLSKVTIFTSIAVFHLDKNMYMENVHDCNLIIIIIIILFV